MLFASELDEVHSVTRNADGELRILLGMLHCIIEKIAVKYIHVEVLTTVGSEVSIHEVYEVSFAAHFVLTEGSRRDSPSVRDTVVRVLERQLRYRSE